MHTYIHSVLYQPYCTAVTKRTLGAMLLGLLITCKRRSSALDSLVSWLTFHRVELAGTRGAVKKSRHLLLAYAFLVVHCIAP